MHCWRLVDFLDVLQQQLESLLCAPFAVLLAFQMYAHLRNTLVALYRREPQRRLTFQDACSAAKQYPPEAMRR